MPSDVAGYLAPEATPVVLEDDALMNFLHDWLHGVLGGTLDKKHVRPWPQLNPPPTPSHEENWMAFTIADRTPDNEPAQQQLDTGKTQLTRHERLEILCVFYGPAANSNAGRIRDGVFVANNREPLFLAGIGLVGVSGLSHVPEEVSDRFVDRIDMTVSLNREIRREYPVLHLLSASGTIQAQRAEETPSSTQWTTPEGD